MARTPPLACTLEQSERLQRARDIRTLGRDALLSVQHRGQTATLRFRPDPGVRARVEAIAAAEGSCCAFLDFEVEQAPEAVELTIAAPAGGEPVMNELASMFAEDTEVPA
jgi:hypothetical protein